jgi:hypothetical protein
MPIRELFRVIWVYGKHGKFRLNEDLKIFLIEQQKYSERLEFQNVCRFKLGGLIVKLQCGGEGGCRIV